MREIKFLIFSVLIFSGLSSSAQVEKKKVKRAFIIEALHSAGKVAPVYRHFPPNVFSNSAEIFLGYQTYGKQPWNKIFNYPRMGVSLIFQDLGNKKMLGEQFSIVPMVYFSTAKKENAKFYAEIRYGLGLACFNHPYDSIRNPDNDGAGSHFTWQFVIGANMRWNVSQYASLQLGGVWYHASNAHTQLPNVGVNNFAAYLGVLIFPFGRIVRDHSLDTFSFDKKWHVNFRVGSGWQERGSAFGPAGGKKYPVYTGAIYATKTVRKIFLLKAGVMYRYYPMYREFIDEFKLFDSNKGIRSSSFTIFLGTEFLLGHFAISLEAGVNIYKPTYKSFFNQFEKSTAVTYYTKRYLATRFGLNYYVRDPYKHPRDNVFAGAYVSANAGQAEFLEFNLGYVF